MEFSLNFFPATEIYFFCQHAYANCLMSMDCKIRARFHAGKEHWYHQYRDANLNRIMHKLLKLNGQLGYRSGLIRGPAR